MSKLVTPNSSVKMTISQADLCRAIEHWLRLLGISHPVEVFSVRTLVNQEKDAEIEYFWGDTSGGADEPDSVDE